VEYGYIGLHRVIYGHRVIGWYVGVYGVISGCLAFYSGIWGLHGII